MSFDSLCDTHLVTLQRPHKIKDTSGGANPGAGPLNKRAWQDVPEFTLQPANVQPMGNQERRVWAQRQVFNTHKAYVTENPGFKVGDQLAVYDPSDTTTVLFYLTVTGSQDMAGQGRAWFIQGSEVNV